VGDAVLRLGTAGAGPTTVGKPTGFDGRGSNSSELGVEGTETGAPGAAGGCDASGGSSGELVGAPVTVPVAWLELPVDCVTTGVFVGIGVLGGTGVLVGGTGVFVEGTEVSVGGFEVLVLVGGTGVLVAVELDPPLTTMAPREDDIWERDPAVPFSRPASSSGPPSCS
jgi:hypothetical protein